MLSKLINRLGLVVMDQNIKYIYNPIKFYEKWYPILFSRSFSKSIMFNDKINVNKKYRFPEEEEFRDQYIKIMTEKLNRDIAEGTVNTCVEWLAGKEKIYYGIVARYADSDYMETLKKNDQYDKELLKSMAKNEEKWLELEKTFSDVRINAIRETLDEIASITIDK